MCIDSKWDTEYTFYLICRIDLSSLFGARDIKVRAGEPLKISLGMAGNPNPVVQWINGEKMIGASDRVGQTVCNETEHFVCKNHDNK